MIDIFTTNIVLEEFDSLVKSFSEVFTGRKHARGSGRPYGLIHKSSLASLGDVLSELEKGMA